MKLIDALLNVDKSDPDIYVDPEVLCQALGVSYTYDKEPERGRLKAYWLVKWYCTDTWVGIRAYYLDDELVAWSKQKGRKFDEEVEFVSAEAARKVLELLWEPPTPTTMKPDQEIDPFYTVDYSSQLLTDYGYYQGREVRVIKKWDGYNHSTDKWHLVQIEDGDQRPVIDLSDFKIPLNAKLPLGQVCDRKAVKTPD